MAIYHCSIKVVSRGKGKSAVAAAAYRSGEKITNDYDGVIHDYTRKGGIAYTEILLPEYAPTEYNNRSILWNAVEQVEKNKNSQLAREIEIALPKELTEEQQKTMVHDYCNQFFVSAGMCCDFCIHDKKDGNPHAHIMLTMRPLEQDGSWGTKQKKEYLFDHNSNKIYDKIKRQYKCNTIQTTDWNEQTKAEEWRSGWADICNRYLTQNCIDERIDHRSYERQGIDQIPTIHMGVAVMQMEQKGISTDRGNINRQIIVDNKALRQLKARIYKLENWLKENGDDEPNLINIFSDMLDGKENKGLYKKIADLKTVAKIHSFLQGNNITTFSQLQGKVKEIQGKHSNIKNKLKSNETRLKTLNEHIKNADNYLNHKSIYKQYKQLKGNKQVEFYDNNTADIILYEAAKRYLDSNLSDKKAFNPKAWKSEVKTLNTEIATLYKEFHLLKEEVKEVEVIKRNVEKLSINDIPKDKNKNMKIDI